MARYLCRRRYARPQHLDPGEALGDDPEGKTYIETIPRRGYCFVAPVRRVLDEGLGTLDTMDAQPRATAQADSRAFRSQRWLLATALLAILLAGAYVLWHHSSHLREVSANRITLAVLPFENLSGSPTQQFFADGFSEELITQWV